MMLLAAAALAASTWSIHTLPFTLATGETARKPLPATTPGGMAVFDYNGDGRLDLFFPNGGVLPNGPWAANRLLRNDGALKFTDVTAEAGLAGAGYDIGAAAADHDGDGWVDLLVCGLRGLTLYRNRDGKFEDVTKAAAIDNQGRWSVGAAWFDMDNDADLDLFVVNYVRWDPGSERECLVNGRPDFCHPRYYDPLPNALFRNDGGGHFTDVSESSGIAAHKGKGMAVAAADWNGDGRTDLFVTNDRAFAFLFLNQGGGRFVERAFEWGVAVPIDGNPVSGMGVHAGDYDNDGRPDLVYTALRDETFPLYRNRGTEFEEVTAKSRLAPLTRLMAGWSVAFADLDNDGWLDIAAARSDALSATGGKGAAAKEPLSWFRNLGTGQFAAGAGWEQAPPAMYRGLVAADFDNDGCLDIAVTALGEAARVLHNPCSSAGHWLQVDAGPRAQRVRAGKAWREAASTAAGYASSYAGPLQFGLGKEARVDVEVVWTDGSRSQATGGAGRTLRIRQ